MPDELGSEWHTLVPTGEPAQWPWAEARYFGTARAALRALLRMLEPPRLWVPSYGCQPFFDSVKDLTNLEVFSDIPGEDPQVCNDRDAAVLLHNPFGLRARAPLVQCRWQIENHTHAPAGVWAQHSTAHYCLASLRKTLPLPDGAVLWSPRGLPLPAEPPPRESTAVRRKLEGMELKAAYLRGEAVDKAAFRALLAQGEADLHEEPSMSPVARSRFATLPEIRSVRARNFSVLEPFAVPSEDPCPSFAVVRFSSAEVRNAAKAALIEVGIFPSALWPVPAGRSAEQEFFEQSFAIPVDVRATAAQLERAAGVLQRFLG